MLHEMRNVRFGEAAARRRDTWPTSALGRLYWWWWHLTGKMLQPT